nr:cellulose synthase A catalytic subunit 7 [UDP-forming] [Tanacetum cinerariifolium]
TIWTDLSSWIKEVRATSLDNERYTPTGGGPLRMPVPPTARVRPRMPPPCVFGPPRPDLSSWIKDVGATSSDDERSTPTGGGPPRMMGPPPAGARPGMSPPFVFGPPRPEDGWKEQMEDWKMQQGNLDAKVNDTIYPDMAMLDEARQPLLRKVSMSLPYEMVIVAQIFILAVFICYIGLRSHGSWISFKNGY